MRRATGEEPQGFGAWLGLQMTRCGYKSNVELEAVTGIGNTTISRWRNGTMSPTVDHLRKLEAPLKTPLIELLVRAGVLSRDEAKVSRDMTISLPAPSIAEAIEHDDTLVDEARDHLRNQYQLLLRIPSPGVPATDPRKKSQARMGRLRAEVRGQQPSEKERERGTGTQGDG